MSKEETKAYVLSLMGGYEEDTLQAAFNEVKDKDDWKAPIKATVKDKTPEELECIKFAVKFYTATEATITPKGNGEALVEAVGYRMGPAGP